MSTQTKLVELLKQKGTGKTMSKALSVAQCNDFTSYLADSSCTIATKATLLIAFFMLENTPEEQAWFDDLSNNYLTRVPHDCHFLFDTQCSTAVPCLQQAIYQLITHKDLSEPLLNTCLDACFNKNTPMVLIVPFLEGLRLKEETLLENTVFLQNLYRRSTHTRIDTPCLIDIATAYDGFNRHPNILLALPPLLASIGFPTIIHGCEDVSPKFGITSYKVLLEAKKNPLKSLIDIKSGLENPHCGWGYCDQSLSFSELHALRECRKAMVKRPVLATVEKFLQPFLSSQQNFLVTGYTHPAYRDKTKDLLSKLDHCDDFMFIRGVEGSPCAPLDRRCPVITSKSSQTHDFSDPTLFDIEKSDQFAPDLSLTSTDSLITITRALTHSKCTEAQWLIYNALLILTSLNLVSDAESTKQNLIEAIDSKKALQHWNAY